MKKGNLLAMVLGLGLMFLSPLGTVLAAEHGGQEHGGAAPAKEHGGQQEHGGAAPAAADDEVATLREASDALRATRPDLAAKLDKLADEHAG